MRYKKSYRYSLFIEKVVKVWNSLTMEAKRVIAADMEYSEPELDGFMTYLYQTNKVSEFADKLNVQY